jgi:hypothetical protein
MPKDRIAETSRVAGDLARALTKLVLATHAVNGKAVIPILEIGAF